MASNKQYVYRPKSMSLESFAVSRGIVESASSNHPLVEKLRMNLSTRGTDGSGFCDLQRRFNAMDKDGSKTLFLEEFKIAFQRCNLNFTDQEITSMFYLFDLSDKKYLDYDEFMIAIRGPVNYRRRQFIEKAFQMIDSEGRGMVDPEEIIDRYDPTNHPDCKNGLKKTQEVFRDFLRVFDVSTEVEGKITRNEFDNYYFNLSASIERDDYFEQVICNAWRMDRTLNMDERNNNGTNTNNYRRNENTRDYSNNNDRRPRTLEELSYDRESSKYRNYEYNAEDSPSRSNNNRSRKSSPNRQQQRGRSMSPKSRSLTAGSIGPRSPMMVYESDQREF